MLWLLAIVAIGFLPALYGDGWAARLGLTFGEWGSTRGAHARIRHRHARVLGPWRAPARSRARHVRDRRHAAVDREARECAAQLLRRLSRLAVGERRLQRAHPRHHAARRAAHPRRGRQARHRYHARHLLLPRQPARSLGQDRAGSSGRSGRKGPLRHRRARHRLASPATPRRTSAGASSRSIPSSSTSPPSRPTSRSSPTASPSSTWSWATRASPSPRSPTAASISFSSMPSPPTRSPCT